MKKITPFLWFDGKAVEAAKYYVSLFKNSKLLGVTRNGKKVMVVSFRLDGQDFLALNGGPHFKFTPAISFSVDCKTQGEVDRLWEKLSKGGEKSRCGWLKDKYGLSWQIVPSVLPRLLQDKDSKKSARVMAAIMTMDKLDIRALQRAHAGK